MQCNSEIIIQLQVKTNSPARMWWIFFATAIFWNRYRLGWVRKSNLISYCSRTSQARCPSFDQPKSCEISV